MINSPTKPAAPLSEEALAEIEALSAKVPDGPWFASMDDADDCPGHRRSGLALVDTGRSADWWIARLCEWHIANFIAASKTNVDALCQAVRAAWAERDRVLTPSIAEARRVLDKGIPETLGDWVRIRESLRHLCTEAEELSRRNQTQADSIMEYEADVTALREQLTQAIRERDLAVAHDRQPYPTAEAYEKVCAALNEHKSCPIENTTIGIKGWNMRSRASVAAAPNHALVQLLESALLHPESAEGNIRQVIEMLNAAASSSSPAEPPPHDSCSHWREGDSDNCVWCGDDLGPTTEADVASPARG